MVHPARERAALKNADMLIPIVVVLSHSKIGRQHVHQSFGGDKEDIEETKRTLLDAFEEESIGVPRKIESIQKFSPGTFTMAMEVMRLLKNEALSVGAETRWKAGKAGKARHGEKRTRTNRIPVSFPRVPVSFP